MNLSPRGLLFWDGNLPSTDGKFVIINGMAARVKDHCWNGHCEAPDTFGYCQRPVFSLGVSKINA